ncbi:MAG: MFS family permease [Lentimonas sp.]|jgi:MFS family permease
MKINLEHRRYLMGVAMFLMYMPMGMWLPSLPNILGAYDARWAVPYAFALGPAMGIFSSLLFAALSDRKLEAQNLLGVLSLLGAGFLWLAFSSLEWGWHASWYLFFQSCNALVSAPMVPLISKIKLANLSNPEKSFPLYSLCGTIGWLMAGLIVSGLSLDASAATGRIAAFIRVLLGLVCFLLPATLPEDRTSRGWKAALGLRAFGLLKNKELRSFYIASTLIAIPYVSFFMLVPAMLVAFGSEYPAAHMTIGQGTEVFAMLLLSTLAGHYRIRSLMIASMLLGVTRFALFALSGATGLLPVIWLGIALHGPIYTFMTIAGRIFIDRRVLSELRGQAQALYSLLTINVAGILGSFFCEIVYQRTVATTVNSWVGLWIVMAVFAMIPLVYFVVGVTKQSSDT